MTPADGDAFFTSAIRPMLPSRWLFERGDKITSFAVLQHGIAQITGRDEARRQFRDFAFLLFNNFI